MSDERGISASEMRARVLGRNRNNLKKEVASVVVAAERTRCVGLMAVAEQASRLGVTFDAEAAIRSRMSVRRARSIVMDAAAAGDAPETSGIAGPRASATGGAAEGTGPTAEQKKGMWAKAMKPHSRRDLPPLPDG